MLGRFVTVCALLSPSIFDPTPNRLADNDASILFLSDSVFFSD